MSTTSISPATLMQPPFQPRFATPASTPPAPGASSSAIGAFDYNQLANTMAGPTGTASAQLNPKFDPASQGAADMIKLQTMAQQWTMAVNLQSTALKMVGDALHGIVQKIG